MVEAVKSLAQKEGGHPYKMVEILLREGLQVHDQEGPQRRIPGLCVVTELELQRDRSARNLRLLLKLVEPPLPIYRNGDTIRIVALIRTQRVSACTLRMTYDLDCLARVGGSDFLDLGGGSYERTFEWKLKAMHTAEATQVKIFAEADSLPQMISIQLIIIND